MNKYLLISIILFNSSCEPSLQMQASGLGDVDSIIEQQKAAG